MFPWSRTASAQSIAQAEEVAREEPRPQASKGYRFTAGRLTVKHPYLGIITVDHLDSHHIIAGIMACDDIGKTRNWWKANIEEAS